MIQVKPLRQIRSYCRREGRMTTAKKDALTILWPRYGLSLEQVGFLDLDTLFQRRAPRVLEIGFGDGKSLLQMALNQPEKDFIGIEVYKTGIAALLVAMDECKISNLKIICGDAIDVLMRHIPDTSFTAVQVFFPDPWPKKRHHKRRLVQRSFISLISQKLVKKGTFHAATDWKEYAEHMMSVVSSFVEFENLAGEHQFSLKPDYRPLTKYEERGKRLGHETWDLIFRKI